jgi:ADP-heptose:LPS heptosyltransferase
MEKFIALSEHLKTQGFEPVFILAEGEKAGWPLERIEVPHFQGLADLCAYICESGYMIGNDSGIGHLASCLKLSTVTICRSLLAANFWRPAWSLGEVVTPSSWIPNVKGLRWRDAHWKRLVGVPKVLKTFNHLVQKASV